MTPLTLSEPGFLKLDIAGPTPAAQSGVVGMEFSAVMRSAQDQSAARTKGAEAPAGGGIARLTEASNAPTSHSASATQTGTARGLPALTDDAGTPIGTPDAVASLAAEDAAVLDLPPIARLPQGLSSTPTTLTRLPNQVVGTSGTWAESATMPGADTPGVTAPEGAKITADGAAPAITPTATDSTEHSGPSPLLVLAHPDGETPNGPVPPSVIADAMPKQAETADSTPAIVTTKGPEDGAISAPADPAAEKTPDGIATTTHNAAVTGLAQQAAAVNDTTAPAEDPAEVPTDLLGKELAHVRRPTPTPSELAADAKPMPQPDTAAKDAAIADTAQKVRAAENTPAPAEDPTEVPTDLLGKELAHVRRPTPTPSELAADAKPMPQPDTAKDAAAKAAAIADMAQKARAAENTPAPAEDPTEVPTDLLGKELAHVRRPTPTPSELAADAKPMPQPDTAKETPVPNGLATDRPYRAETQAVGPAATPTAPDAHISTRTAEAPRAGNGVVGSAPSPGPTAPAAPQTLPSATATKTSAAPATPASPSAPDLTTATKTSTTNEAGPTQVAATTAPLASARVAPDPSVAKGDASAPAAPAPQQQAVAQTAPVRASYAPQSQSTAAPQAQQQPRVNAATAGLIAPDKSAAVSTAETPGATIAAPTITGATVTGATVTGATVTDSPNTETPVGPALRPAPATTAQTVAQASTAPSAPHAPAFAATGAAAATAASAPGMTAKDLRIQSARPTAARATAQPSTPAPTVATTAAASGTPGTAAATAPRAPDAPSPISAEAPTSANAIKLVSPGTTLSADAALRTPTAPVAADVTQPAAPQGAPDQGGTPLPVPPVAPAPIAAPAAPSEVAFSMPAASGPPTSPAAEIAMDQADWPETMVQEIGLETLADGEAIEIQLTPENLGRVQLRVELRDGAATVVIRTDNPEAARQFSDNQQRLSDLLAKAGFDLASHDASTGRHDGGRPGADGKGSSASQTARGDTEAAETPQNGPDQGPHTTRLVDIQA